MGGGMMSQECDDCDGHGRMHVSEDEINFLEVKQTEAYEKAKKRLIKKQPSLSDEDAEKLLDEELEKENKSS